MIPSPFFGSNRTLTGPSGQETLIAPLPIYTDGEVCISCWRLSWRERLSALFLGRVWLWVMSGSTQPPVTLTTAAPFKRVAGEEADRG